MYRRVYRTLVITCKRIFVIKHNIIVSSCGHYKRMRLTTGVYGIQVGIALLIPVFCYSVYVA